MRRNLFSSLENWRDLTQRQPLILRGARQTGKTYLVEEFGNTYFEQTVTINFERDKRFLNCFNVLEPKNILQQIELLINQKITPGKTLLFLDEIQECPQAIQALRYFYEELPTLHVIAAGSLLEFAITDGSFSMPVGRVAYRYLYPMTFEEMLLALGKDNLVEYLSTLSIHDTIPDSIHQQLLADLRLYFVLGGMPSIVRAYVEHKDLLLCREMQSALLQTYQADFAKYATRAQTPNCERVFNRSFELIAKNFKYTDIDSDIDSRALKKAIQLLFKANVLTPIYYSEASGWPLSATQVEKHYKLLFLDLGLVQAAGRLAPEIILHEQLMQLNRGAITEQFVGQHLLAIHTAYEKAQLFYWKRDKKNAQAEIDYLFAFEDLIVPIEVKSGKTGSLKSLHQYRETHATKLGIKLSTDQLDLSSDIWSLPLYLIGQLPRLLRVWRESFETKQNAQAESRLLRARRESNLP